MKRLPFARGSSPWALVVVLAACHPVTPSDAPHVADAGPVGASDGAIANAALDVHDAGAIDPAAPDSATPSAGGTDCAAACANLVKLGCPEGHPKAGKSCLDVCNHTQSTHLTDLHTACLAAAKSVPEVKACKSVTCASPASP